jgi:hypothetical protein
MKSQHRKPVNVCAIRGHFWRGVGSTRDLKQIMQVCQRCLVSRTVDVAKAYPSGERPIEIEKTGEIKMEWEVRDGKLVTEEPCPPQAA